MAKKRSKKIYRAEHGWWMQWSPMNQRWIIAHRDGRSHMETHEHKEDALRRWNHITGRSDV